MTKLALPARSMIVSFKKAHWKVFVHTQNLYIWKFERLEFDDSGQAAGKKRVDRDLVREFQKKSQMSPRATHAAKVSYKADQFRINCALGRNT